MVFNDFFVVGDLYLSIAISGNKVPGLKYEVGRISYINPLDPCPE